MKSFSLIAMFLIATSLGFPAASLLDGLQRVSDLLWNCISSVNS